MQIVLCGNRIIAHGENCFTSMGGTVICEETKRAYQNATIAEVDTIPCDIDSVGYEYRAGNFVPCAPFGKGKGNIAVLCDNDCKAIKDSGVSVSNLCKVVEKEYEGNGIQASLEVDGLVPLFAVISYNPPEGETYTGEKISGTITPHGGYSVCSFSASQSSTVKTKVSGLQSWVVGNTLCWENPDHDKKMELNDSGTKYTAVIIGLEVGSNG